VASCSGSSPRTCATRRCCGGPGGEGLDAGGIADLESQAWQAGVDEVLWSHQPERHGPQLERALARHQASGGLGALLRQRQQELHALRASLNNIPAPIFVKDAEGIYTECNQAFLQYIGLPRHR
jgi:PAS domain-containing protein